MILKYSSLASEIEYPPQGYVYGAGFISPKGEIFSCNIDHEGEELDLRHGDWIILFSDWLLSEGYLDKKPEVGVGMMSGEQSDELRDKLVKKGWVHKNDNKIFKIKKRS